MLTVEGRELLELARPIFDESFQPYPVDKRQLPASRDDVVTIAEAVKQLYEDPPEPADVPPDALRAEVLVTEGDHQSTLVMPVPVPPRAQSLYDAVTPRVARLEATEGGVYHEGKRIR